jgi:hypothetical protein
MAFKIVEMPQASAPPVAAPKFKIVQMPEAAPELAWGETAIDAAKSFGTGIEQGAISLVNTGSDIANFARNTVGGWMGITPEQFQALDQAQSRLGIGVPSNSDTVTKKIEGVQGPLYKPQTTAGEYANTVGQFVPGAVAGPGGVVRKGALAVVPGMASEAAGQITEGTALEPYARVAGALAGGLTASTRGNVGTKQMLKKAPTRETVAADTKAAYGAIDNAGIVYDPNAYKSSAMKIKADLAKKGWDTLQGGQVAPLLNRVNAMLKSRAVADWTKVDGVLQDAKKIIRNPMTDDTTRMHVGIMVGHLEDLVKNGKILTRKGSVARPQMNAMIDTARDLGRRNIIGKDIEKMKNKSEWYLSGPESGLRNQFKNYGSKSYNSLTPSEDAAFRSVVRREGVLNPLHNAGSRLGQIATGSIAASFGGIPGAIASIIGTSAARKFMEIYTMRGVDKALKTVLAGKSEQQKAAVMDAIARGQGRAQTLLTVEGARQGGQVPFLTDANGQPYPYPSRTLLGQ